MSRNIYNKNKIKYNSYIFDCDGVVLNSNKIKSDAYYQIGLEFGELVALRLLDFHLKNAGASRYVKFDYLISNLIDLPCENKNFKIQEFCTKFSNIIQTQMESCEINPSLDDFKSRTSGSQWFVVTGTDQFEIRELLKKRNIDHYFDGGIYGSPKTKKEIFNNLLNKNLIQSPSIYIGDSKYDYEATLKFNIDFIFYSGWTEMSNWREFTSTQKISHITNFNNWMVA